MQILCVVCRRLCIFKSSVIYACVSCRRPCLLSRCKLPVKNHLTLRGANSAMIQKKFLEIICNFLKSAGKIARTRCAWFLFCFSLVEKLARDFEASHIEEQSQWRFTFESHLKTPHTKQWKWKLCVTIKPEITCIRSFLKVYLHMLRKISTLVTFGTILAKSYQINIVIRTFNFANLSCVLEYDTETLT